MPVPPWSRTPHIGLASTDYGSPTLHACAHRTDRNLSADGHSSKRDSSRLYLTFSVTLSWQNKGNWVQARGVNSMLARVM